MAGALGNLVVELSVNMARFTSDMGRAAHISRREWKKVSDAAAQAAQVVSVAALAAGAVVVKLGTDILAAADNANKASQKFGLSAESFTAYSYAAKLADVSNEALGNSLKRLAQNMQDMQAGIGEGRYAFQALDISVTDASGNLKSSEAVMLEVADKFAEMEDGAGKTALAVRLFGRAGADMIPMLNQGAKGLRENAEEAKRFGIVISTEAAKKAEEFNDNLTRLTQQMSGLAHAITFDALPWLSKMAEQMLEGTRIAGGFWSALRLFGLSSITSENAGAKIREIGAALEQLSRDREEFERRGSTFALPQIDKNIADLKKQLEFAKFMQRQAANALDGGDTPGERARMGGGAPKKKAPALVDPEALRREAAERTKIAQQQAEGDEEFARQAAEAWRYWSESETRVRAAEIAKQEALEKQRVQAMIENYDREQQEAIATSEIIVANSKSMTQLYVEEQEKMAKAGERTARELGLVFVSAAEESIRHWQGLRNLLKNIAVDIAQIAFRKSVTEPLGAAVSAGIGKFFGGGSTSGMAAAAGNDGNTYGGLLGSYAVGTDYVPQTGPYMLHQGEAVLTASENAARRSLPVAGAGGRGGGQTTVINADMRGADVAAVARLEAFASRLGARVNNIEHGLAGAWR